MAPAQPLNNHNIYSAGGLKPDPRSGTRLQEFERKIMGNRAVKFSIIYKIMFTSVRHVWISSSNLGYELFDFTWRLPEPRDVNASFACHWQCQRFSLSANASASSGAGGDEATTLWEVDRGLSTLRSNCPPTLRSQAIYIPPQQEKLGSDRQHHTKENLYGAAVLNLYVDKPFVQLISIVIQLSRRRRKSVLCR